MPKQQANSSQLKAQEAWITPAYASGWGDYDTSEWYGVRYMKDAFGFVHMKGLIKNTSGATKPGDNVMFTLPVGYRPVHRVRTVSAGYSGIFQLDIKSNGDVVVMSSIIATEWCSFASVHFRADA